MGFLRNKENSDKAGSFRMLAELAPYGIIISAGPGEKVEYLNSKFTQLFGYALQDIPDVSAWWPKAYPDENYRAKVRRLWEKMVGETAGEKESTSPIETRVTCKNGSEKYIQFTFINTGEKRLIFCIDFTERKKMEDDLYASKAQLSNALEIARLGPWEYDVKRDLFTFNDAFYAIFRTTAEKAGGYTMPAAQYANRFLHPDDAKLVAEETRKAMQTQDPGFSRSLDHRIIYADGQVGYISVRFFVVKDEKGETIRTYGVNQDITERKKMEEEIQKRAKELQVFYNASLGREQRILELKDQLRKLEEKLDRANKSK